MRHAESVIVDRPSSQVWALVGDARHWPTWAPDLSDVELLDDQVATGATFTYVWRNREVRATVDRFAPGRTFGITASQRGYELREWIDLEPLGATTRVTFTMEFDPTTWWTRTAAIVLAPLRVPMIGRPLRTELRALKSAVESAPATDTS